MSRTQLSIKILPSLRLKMQQQADKEKRSLSSMIEIAIESYLTAKSGKP